MTDLPWNYWTEEDELRGAQALAAAGTLVAAGVDPLGSNAVSRLHQIIEARSSQMLDWKYPGNQILGHARSADIPALADAWAEKVGSSFGDAGARLLVDLEDLVGTGTSEGAEGTLPALVDALTGPWLRSPDSSMKSRISAISLGSFSNATTHPWQVASTGRLRR